MEKYYWKKTYVSVTGITNPTELESVACAFQQSGYSIKEAGHVPVAAFLASYKTINGIETKNKRYPKKEMLAELLEVDSKVMKAVHYNTRELSDLPKQINKATKGAYIDLIQLNVIWPNPKHVSKIKESRERTGIILQVSNESMKGMTVRETAKKILLYTGVDHILIDPSRGKGIDFDIDHSAALYSAIKEARPTISIGFAGGLCGENVEQIIKKLSKKLGTTDFSIDAEGKLRDNTKSSDDFVKSQIQETRICDKLNEEFHGNDVLNIDKVRNYLVNARKVLR